MWKAFNELCWTSNWLLVNNDLLKWLYLNNLYLCTVPFSCLLVWPMHLAQVWTHYKIGKLNIWTLFCNVCIDFLNSQIWKEIMLELNGKPSSVTMFSIDFSFQNLVFWNLCEFSVTEITLKSMSPKFWI